MMLSRFCSAGSDIFQSCIFEEVPYTSDKSGSHLWPQTKDWIKPDSNRTHETPENPLEPRFVCFFHSFIIQKLIQSHSVWALRGEQHGTVAMLQLGCRGNLGVIDAPAFRCRLGNALVFILPPVYGASNTSSGHAKHACPSLTVFWKNLVNI